MPNADSLNLFVEGLIAVMITAAFTLFSILAIRDRHRDTAAWHVHTGAAIYGFLIGVVVGFAVVPIRAMVADSATPPERTFLLVIAMLAIMISLRRGLIGRLPFLGPQVKAYRRAFLRRSLEATQKQLDTLQPGSAPTRYHRPGY